MTIEATNQIISSAILAPSAHNTQPWKYKLTEHSIDVFIDWQRHLGVSDPDLRQLYISIGCTITNIIVASHYWGYRPNITYFPHGGLPAKAPTNKKEAAKANKPVASISLQTAAISRDDKITDLFSAIENRRTNRTIFDAKPLTDNERQTFMTTANSTVILVEDNETLKKIAELTEAGTLQTLSRQDFKEELSHWVRNNWTRQHDGMPGYAMGIPAPISLLAPVMVRLAPIHKQEGPKTSQQVQSASALAVVLSETDTPIDWLKAGQILEQIWLAATSANLAASPLVAAIEAGDDIRSQLKKTLNTNLLPQSIIRVGHTTKHKPLRATPRRTVEECLF